MVINISYSISCVCSYPNSNEIMGGKKCFHVCYCRRHRDKAAQWEATQIGRHFGTTAGTLFAMLLTAGDTATQFEAPQLSSAS